MDLAAAVTLELATDDAMVFVEQLPPTPVTHLRGALGRSDDVGEQDGGEDPVEFWHRWLDSHETPDLIHHRREHLR